MTSEQITQQALELSLAERIVLAQLLWQSIEQAAPTNRGESETLSLAKHRLAELASGAAISRSHEQVVDAAWKVLRCK